MDAKEWLKEIYFPKKRTGPELAELINDARLIIESQIRKIESVEKERDYFQQDYIEQSKRAGKLQAEAAIMREALKPFASYGKLYRDSPICHPDVLSIKTDRSTFIKAYEAFAGVKEADNDQR